MNNNTSEIGAIVCEHVVSNKRPIKLIVHNHDDTWEFVCGEIDHHDFIESEIIELNNLIDLDDSTLPIKKLPMGCIAERKGINSKWKYSVIEE